MDARTRMLVGSAAALTLTLTLAGLWIWSPSSLPSLPLRYLAPTTPPAFPSPTETTQYPDPPAQQSTDLPPTNLAPVCSISTLDGFNAWAKWRRPATAAELPQVLTGMKVKAGCLGASS